MKIRQPIILLLLMFSLGCSEKASIDAAEMTDATSMHRRVINHDGIEREYFIHVPDGVALPAPVVYAVHGYTSTATGFEAAHSMNPHADDNGYIAVYPQGSHFVVDEPTGSSYRVTSWNDLAANLGPKDEGPHCVADADAYPCPAECGECNRCAWTGCYDDVGFFEKMMDQVEMEFSTDSGRTYLLGVSNGGMMALRLACNLSDRFTAVAPIIAQLAPGYACGPTADVPMLHLFGDKDDTVRFDGQPGGDGFIYTTAAQTAKVWAHKLSCDIGPKPWQNEYSLAAGLECTAYSDCRTNGQEVVSCMKPGGRHDWPGQRVQSIPATCVTEQQYDTMPGQGHCPEMRDEVVSAGMDVVWNFFSRYPSKE